MLTLAAAECTRTRLREDPNVKGASRCQWPVQRRYESHLRIQVPHKLGCHGCQARHDCRQVLLIVLYLVLHATVMAQGRPVPTNPWQALLDTTCGPSAPTPHNAPTRAR